jgi:hypothetical protein
MDTKNGRGRGRPGRQPQADPEVARPHTTAIDELLKLLAETTRWRDSMQESVVNHRKHLQEGEQLLADYNRKIESYSSAIRALGGKAPD